MALSEMLDVKRNPMSRDELLYLRRYKGLIAERSHTMEVLPVDANKYSGHLNRYLESIGIPISLSTIIKEINDIKSDQEFSSGIRTLLIPNTQQITSLINEMEKELSV